MAKSRRQFLKFLGVSPAIPALTTFLPEKQAPEMPPAVQERLVEVTGAPDPDEVERLVAEGVEKALEAQRVAKQALFSARTFAATATMGSWDWQIDGESGYEPLYPKTQIVHDITFGPIEGPGQGRTRG